MEKDNHSLKEIVKRKDNEIKAMIEQLHEAAERETRLENEIEEIRNQLITREENSIRNFKDMQTRMENTFDDSLQRLTQEHQRALHDQQIKQTELEKELRQKDEELANIMKRYQKVTEEFQVLARQ